MSCFPLHDLPRDHFALDPEKFIPLIAVRHSLSQREMTRNPFVPRNVNILAEEMTWGFRFG